MDITVKIELGTKDRKLFEDLIATLREGQANHKELMAAAKAHWEMAFPENEAMPAEPAEENLSAPEESAPEEGPAELLPPELLPPSYYRDEIRNMMQQYVITDKRNAIKDLLTKYGVAKASALPDDKLEDFAVDLTRVCEG